MNPYIYPGLLISKTKLYPTKAKNIRIENIIVSTSYVTGIKIVDILSKKRKREITEARFICIALIWKYFTNVYSLKAIAYLFGVTHASIINAKIQFEYLYETSHSFRAFCNSVLYDLTQEKIIEHNAYTDKIESFYSNIPYRRKIYISKKLGTNK